MLTLSRLQGATFVLILGFIWTQTNGQYETPNNQCGGYFRYIRGNINFTFNSTTTFPNETEKLCMWTVAPTRQYVNFLITDLRFPAVMICDDYSVTINALEDKGKGVSSSVRYCRDSMPQLPLTLKGSVMVIILKVKSVQQAVTLQGSGFYINYKERSESDWNNSTQLISTYYSWGRPSSEPNYFAAGFLNNGFSTFGFIKANYSNGANYEFQLDYDSITFDYRNNCAPGNDFLMMCAISSSGALITPTIFEVNVTNTQTYRSGYGFFLIYWGSRTCSIGGGGKMQLNFDSIRVSPQIDYEY